MDKCKRALTSVFFLLITSWFSEVYAGSLPWTIEALSPNQIETPINSVSIIKYRVTNTSGEPLVLELSPYQGISQDTTRFGSCRNPISLPPKAACVLQLKVNGNLLQKTIATGPLICQAGKKDQCDQPKLSDRLLVKKAPAALLPTISVEESPLILDTDGTRARLTITNLSTELNATNIHSNFSGTDLEGFVNEIDNSCLDLRPGATCHLTFAAYNNPTAHALINFKIEGSNTNQVTATIKVQETMIVSNLDVITGPTSGGTAVVIKGSAFSGATRVTFGGTDATHVNVVNSTTITAVTPPHIAGLFEVSIYKAVGKTILQKAFTYFPPAVGQRTQGGIIACLNGGLNNLIAAPVDNSFGIRWGIQQMLIGTNAQSNVNGAANTTAIVSVLSSLGAPIDSYAAGLCSNYEIDSQGNSPCQAGNACYNDWFLPAGNNTSVNGQLNCLYRNRVAIGAAPVVYWSSTELNQQLAYFQQFDNAQMPGFEFYNNKDGGSGAARVRCVRAFVP